MSECEREWEKERETVATRRENTRKTDSKRQSKYVMESAYTQPLSQTTDLKCAHLHWNKCAHTYWTEAKPNDLAGYISIGLYTYIMFNGERTNDVASILICFLYYCLHSSSITVEMILLLLRPFFFTSSPFLLVVQKQQQCEWQKWEKMATKLIRICLYILL